MTRYTTVYCMTLAVVALSGCSGSIPEPVPAPLVSSPGPTGSAGSASQSPRPSRDPAPPVAYSWGLPPSDTSVAGNDGPAYAALQRSCTEGRAYLDSVAADGYGFRSPLNVVLFAAGLRLCLGDSSGARDLYDYGAERYGLSGLPEGKPECELYKSVRSVLDQKPRKSFPCPGGQPPQDIVGPTGLIDDPLTLDIDESLPLESESPPATPETTAPVSESPSPPAPSPNPSPSPAPSP